MNLSTKLAITLLVGSASFAASGDAQVKKQRSPVVVELFTSEACSSCPPADALLVELDQKQIVPGVYVIALGEHVDYWNHTGWTDRFSSAKFSRRQSDYSTQFGLDSVYTPQMVVDGRSQFVGNDAQRARDVIGRAAQAPKPATVVVEKNGGELHVRVEGAGAHPAEVVLAITEDGLTTSVSGGENGGRQLRHTAVVRELRTLGTTQNGEFAGRARSPMNPEWRREHLRAVVFVQASTNRHVIGATSVGLK
jgi:hypothetical protein